MGCTKTCERKDHVLYAHYVGAECLYIGRGHPGRERRPWVSHAAKWKGAIPKGTTWDTKLLRQNLDRKESFFLEDIYINWLAPPGNERMGAKHSDEACAKMSAAMMGNKRNLGHKHTDETREKMSVANKGHKTSDETRTKLRAAAIGNKRGMGNKSNLGRMASDEKRAKLRAAHAQGRYTYKARRDRLAAAKKLKTTVEV